MAPVGMEHPACLLLAPRGAEAGLLHAAGREEKEKFGLKCSQEGREWAHCLWHQSPNPLQAELGTFPAYLPIVFPLRRAQEANISPKKQAPIRNTCCTADGRGGVVCTKQQRY